MPGEISRSNPGPADPPPPPDVAAVRAFARRHGLDLAVLASRAPAEPGLRFTTWGRRPEDKILAGDFAEEVGGFVEAGRSTCFDPGGAPKQVLESYQLDAAKNKAEVERLEALLAMSPLWPLGPAETAAFLGDVALLCACVRNYHHARLEVDLGGAYRAQGVVAAALDRLAPLFREGP